MKLAHESFFLKDLGECLRTPKQNLISCLVYHQDAMRAVTRVAIREARLKEIKQEMLNSQKLKVSYVSSVIIHVFSRITFELPHEKTNNLHMRKQRHRSA